MSEYRRQIIEVANYTGWAEKNVPNFKSHIAVELHCGESSNLDG